MVKKHIRKMDPAGRVMIPREFLRETGISPGGKVEIMDYGDFISIRAADAGIPEDQTKGEKSGAAGG